MIEMLLSRIQEVILFWDDIREIFILPRTVRDRVNQCKNKWCYLVG
jgi:hypothetical protein